MGEARLKAEVRERHARRIVAAFETFIDANIECFLRQNSPEEVAHIKHDINGLHDAREALIKILIVPPPKY